MTAALEGRIRFLTSVTEGMLSTFDLDEIIYVILSGITSGEGMGFHRAFLFLLDEHGRGVTCKMAVGPVSGRQAHRIWEEMERKQMDLQSLLQGFRRIRGDPRAWSLTKAMGAFGAPGRAIGARTVRTARASRRSMGLETLVVSCMGRRLSMADNRSTVTFRAPGRRSPVVFRKFVVVPLVHGKECIGAVLADNVFGGRSVSRADIRALRGVTNLATLAIERARLYEKMKRLAETDGLTGLLNRRIYEAKLRSLLEESIRSGQPLSLMLLDLDNFKPINDLYGHLAGDDVLRAVAGTLRETLRAEDLSARYGGDELAVILVKTDLRAAVKVAAKLGASLRALRFPRHGGLRLTVSVGIACTSSAGRTPRGLVEAADRALYRAKRLGRNRIETNG